MDFIRPIMRYLTVEKPASVPLLALRVICNMFAHPEGLFCLSKLVHQWLFLGRKLAVKHHGEILTRVRDSMPIQPKQPHKIAYATLLLNFSIACRNIQEWYVV